MIKISCVWLAILLFAAACSPSSNVSDNSDNVDPDGPFTFGTNTVTGYVTALSNEPFTVYSSYDGNLTVDFPSNSYVSADSYVVCRGTLSAPSNRYPVMYIRAEETTTESNAGDYYVYARGYFSKNVFLRFGPGKYKIIFMLLDTSDGYLHYAAYFYVTNVSPCDFRYLMPTGSVNSLDGDISAKSLELTSGCTNDRQRSLSIHDWVVKNIYYDRINEAQDARTVFRYGSGVCAGYANLTAALFRASGIQARIMYGYTRGTTNDAWSSGINHAWNEVYYGGKWNILDTTWDDPLVNGTSDYPDGRNLRYKYFEPELAVFYLDHTNWYVVASKNEEIDFRDFKPADPPETGM